MYIELEWLVTIVICTLVFLFLVWKSSRLQITKKKDTRPVSGGSVCKYPMCVRCQSRVYDAELIKSRLMKSFKACTSKLITKKLTRVLCTIDSIDRKTEILEELYHESGFTFESTCDSHPHVWWMPSLKRSPFWETSDHIDLKNIASVFESKATILQLQNEYKSAHTKPLLWKENCIPNGKWRIFPFYDQGRKVRETCDVCPNIIRLLESICCFMRGCVYGNAMISVLEPGSQIEAHTGPCNFRLRCHLTLIDNSNYKIQVGSEVRSWEKGKLMIFDDSFVHRVWHDHVKNIADNRVVLIFDVWHPDVDENERQALNFIFSSK